MTALQAIALTNALKELLNSKENKKVLGPKGTFRALNLLSDVNEAARNAASAIQEAAELVDPEGFRTQGGYSAEVSRRREEVEGEGIQGLSVTPFLSEKKLEKMYLSLSADSLSILSELVLIPSGHQNGVEADENGYVQ